MNKDEPCPGCGDGDKVPPHGYFNCPVCDAEWNVEDDAALANKAEGEG